MNSLRKILTGLLLAFAIATLGVAVKDMFRPTPQPPEAAATTQPTDHIAVMYFLIGDKRCELCKRMESWTRECVETKFPEAVKSGEIEFSIIDTDLDENRHYRKDFELPFKTVVVARYENGKAVKWERLDDLWTPAREENKEAFFDMITQGVTQVRSGDSQDSSDDEEAGDE